MRWTGIMFCFGLSPVAFVGAAAAVVTVTIVVDCITLPSLVTVLPFSSFCVTIDESFDEEELPPSAIGFPVASSCESVGSPFSSGNWSASSWLIELSGEMESSSKIFVGSDTSCETVSEDSFA
uniref:Putative secreted protein n=1 Tax=Anopheles darlingi TaxID=43151 RepID=A0A2M4DIU8_ANODA